MGDSNGDNWFYTGITYLIPKSEPTKGSDFRPITCMSNLYKLTTKCVIQVLQLIVEKRGLLSENQLGIVRKVQGAKEQALLNIAIFSTIRINFILLGWMLKKLLTQPIIITLLV